MRYMLFILLLLCICAHAFADRTIQPGEEFAIAAGQDPERITIPVSGSDEVFYVDITAAQDDAIMNLDYLDESNPYPGAEHPGDNAVLFLRLGVRKPLGAGVPIINFALRYRYGDSTPKMLSVDRSDVRFGMYTGGKYVLFMPGADNSAVHTRTITQGVATSTDITATTTVLGLFSGNLFQDIYDKFDTEYSIAGAGRHQYAFLVSSTEKDELYVDILTENTNFNFEVINHGSKSPVSASSYPTGTNKALLVVSLNIVNRAQVPVFNAILRYHYDTKVTNKISQVDLKTLQWAIFDDASQKWRAFDADQEKENNLVTSNVIQTGSSLIDFAQNSNVLGLFAKSGSSGIGGGDGDGDGHGDGNGNGGGQKDGKNGSGSSTTANNLIATTTLIGIIAITLLL